LLLKKISRALALIIVPFLGFLIIRFIALTNKKKFHNIAEIGDEPTIFACWHGELLMLPYLYFYYRKNPHAKVLISSHFDGNLIAKTVKYFGLDTISGSTNRNAAKVLIQGIKALNDGYDIGITPDGPKGPRREVADGIIIMAQKAKAKIVLVNIVPSKYWEFNSWDKFRVPKPFGTLNYYSSGMLDVSEMDFEEAKALIKMEFLKHEY